VTAVPLLSGVSGSETGEFALSYPTNLEPVIVDSKISKGQFKAVPGAVTLGTGSGIDRGGITWDGIHYRVLGTKLCIVAPTGDISIIGDVGSGGRCAFDYSFDRLGVNSGDRLYYYDANTGLQQVTDVDLGSVKDMLWIDGYFMTTDGTYVVVTELSDPFSIQPLKYGSAEEDPDPITGLIKIRDEAYVIGRHTIQLFRNVGGNGFPFQTMRNATTVPAGCVSSTAKCIIGNDFAFAGSGRGEGLNIYVTSQGEASAIGCKELCDAMDALKDPSVIEMEERASEGERRILVHLPTETWAYLVNASRMAGQPIWYKLKTDNHGYRCRNAVTAYGLTIVGDTKSGAIGSLTNLDNFHFGIDPGWQFDCGMLYNEAVGAIVHSVELVGLPGRGGDGAVFMSLTRDGETFGIERSIVIRAAERSKRLAWRPHARIGNYLGMRFRGAGKCLPGVAACEVKAVPLST
jgi:hypothetical protein